jgi:hypothetical protein
MRARVKLNTGLPEFSDDPDGDGERRDRKIVA